MSCSETTLSLGVYLLGSLDATERAEVESHLRDCASCRAELDDLVVLPSMLERLSLEDFAIEPPDVPADLFDRVAARVRQDEQVAPVHQLRRHRRLLSVAAAVVLVAGGSVAVAALTIGNNSATTTVQGAQGHIHMRVQLAAQTSGTRLQVSVGGLPEDEHCWLVAIAKDGSRDDAGRWTATYAGRAQVTGSTVIARQDLSQLVLLGTGGRQLVTVNV